MVMGYTLVVRENIFDKVMFEVKSNTKKEQVTRLEKKNARHREEQKER